ncbi:MAG TPA: hypothetical protein VFZ65_22400 [Planctomycetota bacterium]|nr:hypothetical protein [Planctomycetota bacterium]
MAMLGNGDLVAGGTFSTASGVPARNIARWDGATWVGLGAGVTGPYQYVLALTLLPNGDLSVAGVFTTAGTGPAANLARWTGSSWLPPSGGVAVMPAVVLAAAALPNGQAAVGGSESPSGWAAPNYVARWDGTAWSAINTGMLGVYSTPVVLAMTTLPNGDLWAGGRFTTAGFFANGLARWSGSSWQPVGLGVQGIATAFATLPNGDLAVGGNFQTLGSNPVFGIARWNGTTWSQLALVGGAYEIRAMLAHPNGDLTVSGVINPGPFGTPLILRWVGTTWLPLGTWTDALVDAAALVSMPNGDIVAGGSFLGAGGTPANYIARWNGATWSALGTGMNGPVLSLAVLPNGDLMAGGDFTTAGGLAARGVARWNGSAWSAPSSGPGVVGRVRALVMLTEGELLAGGEFQSVDSMPTVNVASLTTTCPAAATALGAGCTGTSGAPTLAASALPWLGSSFRSTCGPIVAGSLALALVGLTSPGTPLSQLHPAAAPGCALLASPDLTSVLLPVGGAIAYELAIPNSLSLVGVQIWHQVLEVQLGAGPQITALIGSSGLGLTIGAF